MSSIRQEIGPSVAEFTERLVQLGDRNGSAPRTWNPLDNTPSCGKQDGAVLAPCAAARTGDIADRQDRPTGSVNGLKFSSGKESDGAIVGRPKRIRCAVGARQLLDFESSQGTYP